MFASVKESALQQLRSCLRLEPTIEQRECRAVFLLHDTSPEELLFTRALSITYGSQVSYRFDPRGAGSLLLSVWSVQWTGE